MTQPQESITARLIDAAAELLQVSHSAVAVEQQPGDLTSDQIDAAIIKSGVMDRAWPLQTALHAFARDIAHLASQSQATRAVPDLHSAIMNLPCQRTMSHFITRDEMLAYKEGHLDARHAAAELVNEDEAAQEVTQQAAPEVPLWDDNGEPWNEAAEKVERERITQQAAKAETAEQADEVLHQAIFNALSNHRMVRMFEVEDDGTLGNSYPLIDRLCLDDGRDIESGKDEIEALADSILDALDDELLAGRFRAQGGITNDKGSDLAPTTSTVSAPLGYISDDAMATLSAGSGVLTAIVPRAINGADLAIYAGTVSAPEEVRNAAPVISSYDLEKVKSLKYKFVDELIHSGVQYRTCGAISATLNQIIDESEKVASAAPRTTSGKGEAA